MWERSGEQFWRLLCTLVVNCGSLLLLYFATVFGLMFSYGVEYLQCLGNVLLLQYIVYQNETFHVTKYTICDQAWGNFCDRFGRFRDNLGTIVVTWIPRLMAWKSCDCLFRFGCRKGGVGLLKNQETKN